MALISSHAAKEGTPPKPFSMACMRQLPLPQHKTAIEQIKCNQQETDTSAAQHIGNPEAPVREEHNQTRQKQENARQTSEEED